VGNTTSLPSVIVQAEFPKAAFGQVVSTIIAINQFTYSFGPGLLGWLRDGFGSYDAAFTGCLILQLAAVAILLFGGSRRGGSAVCASRGRRHRNRIVPSGGCSRRSERPPAGRRGSDEMRRPRAQGVVPPVGLGARVQGSALSPLVFTRSLAFHPSRSYSAMHVSANCFQRSYWPEPSAPKSA